MPTSATGNDPGARVGPGDGHAAPRTAGFTYIELLVTLFLIGLLVSLAVLSLPSESAADRLEREAARLHARMDLAREEAVLGVRSLGLRVEPDGYHFLVLGDGIWRALPDIRALPAHELPGEMRLAVELDGIEVALADPEEEQEGRPPPQIFFLASGELLPDFELRLQSGETDVEFTISPGDEQWLQRSDSRD